MDRLYTDERELNFPWPELLLVLIFSLVVTLPFLGEPHFASRGEAREALATRSVFSGSVILSRGYSDSVASKPPFLHWAGAGSSIFIGKVTEFTARFPSALASIIFCLGFYLFLARRISRPVALFAPLCLLLSPEWLRASLTSRVDMVHSSALAAALLLWYARHEESKRKYLLGITVLLTISTLSKGPVSLILFGMVITVFSLVQKQSVQTLSKELLTVLAPSAVLSGIWYFLAAYMGGQEFLHRFLYENVERFAGTTEDPPHKHSVFYLFAMTIVGLFPWSVLYLATRRLAIPSFAALRRIPTLDTLTQFAIVATLCIFLFYSIPSGKRGVYVLAAYPFIIVLLAQCLIDGFDTFPQRGAKIVVILSSFVAAIFIGALCVAPLFLTGVQRGYLVEELTVARVIFLLLPVCTAIGLIAQQWRPRKGYPLWSSLILVLSISLSVQKSVLPVASKDAGREAFADVVREKVPESQKVYSFKAAFYDISFYLGRTIYDQSASPHEGAFVLLFVRDLPYFTPLLGPRGLAVQEVARSRRPVFSPKDEVVLVQIVPQQNVTVG